jgi:hypothetical protein
MPSIPKTSIFMVVSSAIVNGDGGGAELLDATLEVCLIVLRHRAGPAAYDDLVAASLAYPEVS